jgi:hypothetical protein
MTTGTVYDGVLYNGDGSGEGGNVYAYNVTTGKLLWDYQSPGMGNTGYWVTIPTTIGAYAAGNIYVYSGEHSPGPTLEPGFQIGDINATTGKEIWNITFWNGGGTKFSIADGYMVALNVFDNQLYAFSKGPTDTTVQTPLGGVTQGQDFTIQGTVMDISPGASQANIKARFPNGLPAVSDADMTAWMEYAYMQNPEPANVVGVAVTVTAIDPNGNTVQLGTTHSDSSGLYSLKVDTSKLAAGPGQYTVIVNFAGSNSYWPSSGESTFTLNAAAPTPAPTAAPPTGLASTSSLELGIAVIAIIIIIIGAIIIVLMLRKRP